MEAPQAKPNREKSGKDPGTAPSKLAEDVPPKQKAAVASSVLEQTATTTKEVVQHAVMEPSARVAAVVAEKPRQLFDNITSAFLPSSQDDDAPANEQTPLLKSLTETIFHKTAYSGTTEKGAEQSKKEQTLMNERILEDEENEESIASETSLANSETPSMTRTIRLGRWGSLLGSDIAIGLGVAVLLSAAAELTHQGWLTVVAALVGAFCLGYGTGHWRANHKIWLKQQQQLESIAKKAIRRSFPEHRASLIQRSVAHPTKAATTERQQAQQNGSYAILSNLLGLQEQLVLDVEQFASPFSYVETLSSWFSSPEDAVAATQPSETVSVETRATGQGKQQFGRIQLASATQHMLQQELEPIGCVQGMDIFLSSNGLAVEGVGEHPALLEAGIRKDPASPMLILNALSHVGNLILYFSVPKDLLQKDDETVPANVQRRRDQFHRFWHGTDDYRSARLRMASAFVDAPFAIKAVAPTRMDPFLVTRPLNPGSWRQYPASGSFDDSPLAPALELQMDLAAAKYMRYGVGLAKSYLHTLVLDVALLICPDFDDPNDDNEMLLVGCFRLDHVDFENSPEFPAAVATSEPGEELRKAVERQSQLLQRASMLSRQNELLHESLEDNDDILSLESQDD